jgi:serine protease Do
MKGASINMSTTRTRHLATFLLVLGAVVFGMILAGGLQLTLPGMAADNDIALSATHIASSRPAIATLPSFADLAQAVDPAVVSIQAATIEKGNSSRDPRRGGRGGRGGSDPFEFFFGPRQQRPDGQDDSQSPQDFRSDAGGSGFVISRDGLVVTNYHVVEGASEVKVHLNDRDYQAEVKGTDPSTDIALLKINAGHDLRFVELGDSDSVRPGDWVMVVGNPLNLDKTVTTGVISAKGRSLGISDASFENFIQTDAAINFGNSGGPLLDLQGRVIGIATAINYGAENIGFAVPVNTLKQVLPQLRDKGKVSRGYLGIQIGNVTYAQAQAFGLQSTDGALVGSVEDGTPAAKGGIQHGDVITAVDGIKIKTTRDLINYVSAKGPSSTVTLQIYRDGKTLDRQVKLSERPGQREQESRLPEKGETGIDWLGIQYQDLTSGLRSTHGVPESTDGVVVTNVAPSSPLYEQAVRPGSIITEVNGQPVKSVADFEKAVKGAKPKSYLRLYVLSFGQRGTRAQPFFAVVQVP